MLRQRNSTHFQKKKRLKSQESYHFGFFRMTQLALTVGHLTKQYHNYRLSLDYNSAENWQSSPVYLAI